MLDVLILLGPNSSAADLGAITQPMQAANEISGEPVIDWNYETITDVLPVLTCGIKLGPLRKMRDVYRKTLIFLTLRKLSDFQFISLINAKLLNCGLLFFEGVLVYYLSKKIKNNTMFFLFGLAMFSLSLTRGPTKAIVSFLFNGSVLS